AFKAIALVALAGVFDRKKHPGKSGLLVSGFFLGLAVYERTYPVWFTAAIGITLVLLYLTKFAKLKFAHLFWFVIGILFGASIFILYNLKFDFPILRLIEQGGPIPTGDNLTFS